MNVLKNSGKLVLALAVMVGMSLASNALAADTGSVAGKVVGKDGSAVAGAKVRLMSPGDFKGKGKRPNDAAPADREAGPKGKGERPKPVAEAMTGSDGTFNLADIPAGDYLLVARAKGAGMGREKVSVSAGQTSDVTLTLSERKREGGDKKDRKRKDRAKD